MRLHAFAGGMEDLDGGDQLASEFAAHVNQLALKAPLQHRRPSPLEPPTAAVAAQMDALQINDWPEPDAGVNTALAFAKPYQCEDLVTAAPLQGGLDASTPLPLPTPRFSRRGSSSSKNGSSDSRQGSSSSGSSVSETLVRSWSAREAWLTPQEFAAELHSTTYAPLLGCDSWRACSTMVFPPTRVGHRAVQAVEVLAGSKARRGNDSSSHSSSSNHSSSSSSSSAHRRGGDGDAGLQRFTYTFVLERITSGPYRDCWLTVGVRPGNYSV